MYEFHLRHYDRAGVLKHAFLEPLWARYTESVSGDEPLVFALNADDPVIADIEEFDIIEGRLRNKDLGIEDSGDFTRAFVGILRYWDLETDDDGLSFYTFYAPHERHILSWRSVLWYAGIANRSEFNGAPAETIMKTLVQYNCTADASIANGRQREGDLAAGMGIDITIAADAGAGESLSASVMGANLLSVLQKLNGQAGGDFSLDWQGGNDWEFDFHLGQLGADKSTGADRVLFSLKNDTMRNPRLRRRGAQATTAIAGGQGEGVDRMIAAVDGPDYAAGYDLETFVDARNEPAAAGVAFRGLAKLEDLRLSEELTFDVLQTGNQFYSPIAVAGRKTYRAGDLVLAVYGVEETRKVEQVIVNWKAPQKDDPWQVSIVTREVSYAGS
ncbi:MAG: siphovirus ReqiPepy6 Gp37-like family protein [Anaerolineales bacterium]|nr:siphovirus ReqiPepy6 Gp37-like family protein [Anaerolineales bacterium]